MIGVLCAPLLIGLASTCLLARCCPAIALFMRILRRWQKSLLAVVTLPLPASFHPLKLATLPPLLGGIKYKEEEIYLKVRGRKCEEDTLSNRQSYATFKAPLTKETPPLYSV